MHADDRKRWDHLVDAAVAVTSELDLTSTLARIVQQARELTGAPYGALGVLGPDDESLVEFVTDGIDDEVVRRIGHPPRGHGVLGVVLREGRVLRLDDLASHPASVGFPPHHPPMDSFLGVPVRVGGRVFGDLYLADKPGGFTEEDERLVTGLAAVAGGAITNARLFDELRRTRAELATAAVSEDRNRIARDLHDLVIGRLFAVGLKVDRIARHVDEPWADRATQAVDDIDRAIADLRGAIFALGSGTGSDRARLERLITAAAAPLGFAPDVRIEGDIGRVPAGLRNDVHAVVNEAFANVARHAHASHASVRLVVRDAGIGVTVTDDGTGLAGAVPASGLANLRDRAERAGGRFSVGPGDGGVGTRLEWRVPLPIE